MSNLGLSRHAGRAADSWTIWNTASRIHDQVVQHHSWSWQSPSRREDCFGILLPVLLWSQFVIVHKVHEHSLSFILPFVFCLISTNDAGIPKHVWRIFWRLLRRSVTMDPWLDKLLLLTLSILSEWRIEASSGTCIPVCLGYTPPNRYGGTLWSSRWNIWSCAVHASPLCATWRTKWISLRWSSTVS